MGKVKPTKDAIKFEGRVARRATALLLVRYRSSREDAGRLRRPAHRSRLRASGALALALALLMRRATIAL